MNLIWDFILKMLAPIVAFIGKIYAPFSKKKITGDEYYLWRDLIRPGYVLLTSTKGQLSNLINPSELNHGGIYTGGDKIKYVAEALGSGVKVNNLVKFMTSVDVIVIIKPKFGNHQQHKMAGESALKYIGLPYDYIFKKGDDAFYCFELIAKAYNDVMPDKMLKCKEIVKGKRIYDSETFTKDSDNWEIVMDSREYFKNKEK
jgi:hypothetical protein